MATVLARAMAPARHARITADATGTTHGGKYAFSKIRISVIDDTSERN